MDRKKIWKYVGRLVPILGLILFVYIIVDVGIDNIINSFKSIPLHLYLIASLFTIPKFFVYAHKWQYILKKQKLDLPLIHVARIYLIAFFYGSVTPGAVGYHIRVYHVREKTKASLEKCIANSLIDVSIGFITGFFLALIGSILLIDKFPGLFPLVLGFFIFYIVMFLVLVTKKIGSKLFVIFVRPFIPSKYKEKIDKSVDKLYENIPRIRDIAYPFIAESFTWFIAALQVYIISLAFDISVPFHIIIFCAIISVAAIAILPISSGGLGVREGTFVYLMSSFGVDPGVAFVISLGGFFVKILVPGVIGLIISFVKKD